MKRFWTVISVALLSAVLSARGGSTVPAVSVSGTSSGGSTGGGSDGGSSSIYLNIVPPGSNGNFAGGVGLQGKVLSYPNNFTDQDTLYGDLSYAKSAAAWSPIFWVMRPASLTLMPIWR